MTQRSQPKFTPGPWQLQECSNGGMLLLRGSYGSHQQSHLQVLPIADAHLIAAAPEMYEALKEAQLWMTKGNDGVLSFNEMRRQAEAALAKAEGRVK